MGRISPEGIEAIKRANAARGFGVKGSAISQKSIATRRAKAPRHITSEAKRAAGLAASKMVAQRANDRMVMRLKYIMANLPAPVFTYRQSGAVDYTYPIRVGLTRGKTLSVSDRVELTMSILTVTANNGGAPSSAPALFTRRIKEFLPDGIAPSDDLFYHKEKIKSEEVKKTLEEYYIWVEDYMAKCERKLAGMYLQSVGGKNSPYLEVLQRRFRERWALNPCCGTSIKASLKQEKTPDEENDENIGSVTFNFEVVTGGDSQAKGDS